MCYANSARAVRSVRSTLEPPRRKLNCVEPQLGSTARACGRRSAWLASAPGIRCRVPRRHHMDAEEPFAGMVVVIAIGIAVVVGLILVSVLMV